MYKHVVAMLVLACALTIVSGAPVWSTEGGVVISKIQMESASSATHELIELHNNGDYDVDITGWCVNYASSAAAYDEKGKQLTCFESLEVGQHIFLPAHTSALALSKDLSASTEPVIGSDMQFSAGMAAAGGHIILLDALSGEVDRVGWGSAKSAEGGSPIPSTTDHHLLRRLPGGPGVLQDTDVNYQDFEAYPQPDSYEYGAIYEVMDVCTNIDDIQTSIPEGKESDGAGGCYEHDVCINLAGIQTGVPPAFEKDDADFCTFSLEPLVITELLPSPEGDDGQNEFVEIFNPNDESVSLEYMKLEITTASGGAEEVQLLPSVLSPQGYTAFYSLSLHFTLLNSSASVALVVGNGQLLGQTVVYADPPEGEAWASFDSDWSYTNRPTPGLANLPSLEEIPVITELKPCGPGQYRNPATNRCKAIASTTSTLVPCKDGQYRSEVTNRCRSIATDASLEACPLGQYRNPETNRCKSILGATTTAAACGPGEERNPATNRCRKIQLTAIPSAPFAVEPVATQTNPIEWWVLASTATAVVGYGIWEWRQELAGAWKKLLARLL